MRGRRQFVAVALAGVAVLGTGVVEATTWADPKVSYPSSWDARVLPIVRFVETDRGLRFKHPVPVSFLDDSAFDKRVAVPAPETKQDKEDVARFVGTLRALGLVHGPLDLNKAYDTLGKSSIIGLYVSDKKAVFVRGATLDAYTRVTLAHELTHALQDQYFNLKKLHDDAPGGDSTAVTALIEGDAVRIQTDYEKSLNAADTKAYAKAQADAASGPDEAAGVPAVLRDFLSFPYVFGPVLLDSLTQVDGNAAVDRAFRSPPSTEAQILDPVLHPASERPTAVPTPALPPGAKRLDTAGPFGQVSLFEVIGSWLGYAPAWKAVSGWTGDTSVPYSDQGRTCIAIDAATDGAASAALLLAALQKWATHVPGARVTTAGDLVTVRSCDPGPKGAALPAKGVAAFDVLAARASLIHEVMSGGAGYPLGRCLADGVIAALGPAGYGDLTASVLPPARLKALQKLAGQVADRCRGGG